jgi:broad specificity phosphatase PhoE
VILVASPDSGDVERQASAIAAEIRDRLGRRQPIEAVYAAPDGIAAEVARLVAAEIGLPAPEPRPGLRLSGSEQALAGALAGAIAEVSEDAWAVAEELRDSHPDEAQVVAVTNATVVYALVCKALGLPVESHIRFRIDPGSLSAVAFRQQRTILALLNEHCHLQTIET